ncbi:protein transport protein HofC [Photorhabdus heterorhabditis]|uniref:Protein transport protein HofC n=1 Tax=Photorhabdus heterorhabditis TaxID=880156 RepID=A0A5B0X936_9GAMM|nr:protein transport protein HofC [Photorhabdus heterorhabditis]KAA1194977.1 protein transport protein HofC [Photorhabdus heterorhabditis]KOY61791.1 type IV pilin biosynthesis protein [Photorhabdus heterorhabditis]
MKIHYIYHWQAINNKGEISKGKSLCDNRKTLYQQLIHVGLQPYNIKCDKWIFYHHQQIAYRINFIRQLATLLSSGMPLLNCLNILIRECVNPLWHCVLSDISKNITCGESLSASLKNYPLLFPTLFYQLIAIGELTGQLENCCQLLVKQQEQQDKLQKKIAKALRYPLIITVVASIIILLMLIFVLPEFEHIYRSFDAQLPLLTRSLLITSNWLIQYGGYGAIGLIVLLLSYLQLRQRHIIWVVREKNLILRLPIIAKLISCQQLGQLFHILFMTQKAGLTLTAGLDSAIASINHPVFLKATKFLRTQINQGIPMSEALKQQPCFPALCQQFISVGEESGNLELLLENLAEWYQQQALEISENMAQLLEPILMVIIAIIVGILLLAMYLPIFQLGTILT